jgi:ribose-phosphate pyrophosphokinase
MKIYSLSNSVSFATALVKEMHFETMRPNLLTEEEILKAYKIDADRGRFKYPLNKVRKQTFADGEINVVFDESVRGETLVIVAQVQMPYENIFELILTLDAARRSAAKEVILVIPYLLHSRQERRDDKRSPITARVIADILQNAGADRILSMDIHTSAIEGFYSIPFDKLYPFEVFVEFIKELNIQDLCLVSPDFGFIKKMEKYQEALQCDMAVINKTRVKANEVSKMDLIGSVEGKNVIIIDDIIDTATTLVKAAALLKEKGAKDINVFATHGVLSPKDGTSAEEKLCNSDITQVYISNTVARTTPANCVDKITYLDITKLFAKALLKIKYE